MQKTDSRYFGNENSKKELKQDEGNRNRPAYR